ncbi:MAG TPA: GntR family transcriptional regulator [Myxococcota bacterium]|nr:GntR family transcriptional regulator [Myxococcota bacterium]
MHITLSQASGVPFYRQVSDQVTELVESGALVPGQRLPSVRELAKQLLVSLITIRRAYADLATAGLIVRRQGQGTFVAYNDNGAARAQAVRAEAIEALGQAIARARRAGLEPDEIVEVVNTLLQEPKQ